jgi:hypothetical protein
VTLRRLALAIGAILLVAGVIGLLVPVSTSGSDGHQVGCGNGIAADTSQAQKANDSGVVADVPILNQLVPHTDFVAQCESAISGRREWSIPLAVIGALAVAGALLLRSRSGRGASAL